MAFRRDGRVLRVPEDVPHARGRLVIFLHGLFETEHAWTAAGEGYAPRLERSLGVTALHVRYNSGRHISSNGRDLARLLDETVAAWPVPVRGGRAGRALDGRARRPQRLPPRAARSPRT